MPYEWEKHKLSLVTGPNDVLVAVFPQRSEGTSRRKNVVWFDVTHERSFPLTKVTKDEPDQFVFEDDQKRRFTLRPMTLKDYRDKVQDKLNGAPDFDDEQAMVKHFTKTVFGRGLA